MKNVNNELIKPTPQPNEYTTTWEDDYIGDIGYDDDVLECGCCACCGCSCNLYPDTLKIMYDLDWVVEIDCEPLEFVEKFTAFLESNGWCGGGFTKPHNHSEEQ